MRTGHAGEQQAAVWLRTQGYIILEQNYRIPRAEIDIIAQAGDTLCFVEVKRRTQFVFGTPAEAVNRRKQAKIALAASHYLARHFPDQDPPCRFDVVSVNPGGDLELMIDAFQAP